MKKSRERARVSALYDVVRHRSGHSRILGYARVSTAGQDLASQLDALQRAGCSRVYSEKSSGRTVDRPGWEALVEVARPGDTVVVSSLDRIGRRASEVCACFEHLARERIHVKCISEGIDTSGPAGRMAVPIFAALAQLMREQSRERTMQGIEAARQRGRVPGRPTVLNAAKVDQVRHLHAQHHSQRAIAKAVGLSRRSVERALVLPDVTHSKQLSLEVAK